MNLSFADLEWAEEQLKRLTYKPGWKMGMCDPDGPYGDPSVRIEFYAQDTYNPGGRQIKVMSREQIPGIVLAKRDEVRFVRYVQEALLKVERHESQEWLKRDGVIFDNPHK